MAITGMIAGARWNYSGAIADTADSAASFASSGWFHFLNMDASFGWYSGNGVINCWARQEMCEFL